MAEQAEHQFSLSQLLHDASRNNNGKHKTSRVAARRQRDRLLDIAARVTGFSHDDILLRKSSHAAAHVRVAIYHIMYREYRHSMSAIAEVFGHSDHSTISHLMKAGKVAPDVAYYIERLKAHLGEAEKEHALTKWCRTKLLEEITPEEDRMLLRISAMLKRHGWKMRIRKLEEGE